MNIVHFMERCEPTQQGFVSCLYRGSRDNYDNRASQKLDY